MVTQMTVRNFLLKDILLATAEVVFSVLGFCRGSGISHEVLTPATQAQRA